MSVKIKQVVYELLPTGEYPAMVETIDVEKGKFGDQLKWRFALEGEHVGRKLVGWCGASFSVKSRAYLWTRAALGHDIPSDWDFDSDMLLGRPVKLVVLVATGTDGGEYNKIAEIKPARAAVRAPVARTQPVAVPVQPVAPPLDDGHWDRVLVAEPLDVDGEPMPF